MESSPEQRNRNSGIIDAVVGLGCMAVGSAGTIVGAAVKASREIHYGGATYAVENLLQNNSHHSTELIVASIALVGIGAAEWFRGIRQLSGEE